MKNNRFVAAVLVPALALLTLFVVVPIVASFVISLFDFNPLMTGHPFMGLENYRRLFNEDLYRISVRNTLVFVFITSSINITLGLVLANLISGVQQKWLRNLILVCIFLPCVVPIANSAVVWSRSLYAGRTGLINILLAKLGIESINWMGDSTMIMPALIMFTVWADMGYNTVLLTAGAESIPHDLYEAASIDGAGPLLRFFKITVPLLGRVMMFIIPMTLMAHFQMFAQFEIMARNGGPSRAGQVLTTYIYYSGFRAKDLGYASAISVTLFLMILVITMVQRRISRIDWEY